MRICGKATAALVLLALMLTMIPGTVFGMEFSDVPSTASYYQAVDNLSNIGVILGRGDGTFSPNDKTTRAEFCAFLARATGYDADTYRAKSLPFSDVSDKYWARSYISYCYEKGYINGMLDGTFCPADGVTHEQAVKMIVCASGVGDESLTSVGPKWYSGYINAAQKFSLLTNVQVRIAAVANRAFVAQVVYNAMQVGGLSVAQKPTATETPTPTVTPTPTQTPTPTPIPTKKPGKLLVVLDPGHNYSITDTGATGNGLREQDVTFRIAEKVKPLLEANGFQVIMTRNKLEDNVSEESVVASLKRRAAIANEAGADLFLSIHCNAGGGSGTETYYYENSENGKALAEVIQTHVVKSVGLENRGVKSANFAVLRYTGMVAALLETAFIDTESDAAKLGSTQGQKAYAVGIAKGICAYFGKTYQE